MWGLAVTVECNQRVGLPEPFDEASESPHTWHGRQAFARADVTRINGERSDCCAHRNC